MPDYIYIYIYSITIFFGIFYHKKWRSNVQLKFFFGFLVYSFLTEIAGAFIIHKLNIRANLIYNTWFLVNSIFYMLLFLSIIKAPKKRKVIVVLISLFLMYSAVNIFFLKDIRIQIFIDCFILGQLFVVITIMIYYTELLKSNVILSIQKSLFFWISTGVLIFNIGMIPVFVIAELIDYEGIFNYIILGLNVFMSLCFIIGFIISEKGYNK